MKWNDNNRRLSAAVFETIVQNTAWRMKLDYMGPDSTYNREARDLPLGGFGSMLCCDYYELAIARGLEYVTANGLRLDRDNSTVAGVEFILFRPFDLSKRSTHHARKLEEARHCPRGYRPRRCFFCGEEAVERPWRNGDSSGTDWAFPDQQCRAYLDVMIGPDPVPALLKRVAVNVAAVDRLRQGPRDYKSVQAAFDEALELGLKFMRLADYVRPELFVEANTAAARKSDFNQAAAMALTAAADTLQLPDMRPCSPYHPDDIQEAASKRRAA